MLSRVEFLILPTLIRISATTQLVSLIWQLAAIFSAKSAIETAYAGYVDVHVGVIAQVLGWVGLGLIWAIWLGLARIISTMRWDIALVDD